MKSIQLYVSVPITCLKSPKAREYFETLTCPAPATVYGMLLALVGEENRAVHLGAEIAIALIGETSISTVLRTVWRVKNRNDQPGLGNNKRPDYQELLTGLKFTILVRQGVNEAEPSLASRLIAAFEKPELVKRYGGLSLGESTHLVDEIRPWRDTDNEVSGNLLVLDVNGDLTLPVWVDHVGSEKTVFNQYRLSEEMSLREISVRNDCWSIIQN